MTIKDLYKMCENTDSHTIFEIYDRGVYIGKYTYSDYNLAYEPKKLIAFKLFQGDRLIVAVHYW